MSIRKGMWVNHNGRIGIAAALNDFVTEDNYTAPTAAEVHYVDDQGATTLVAPNVPADELTQAAYKSIPKARRPEKAAAQTLGYL